MAYVDGFVAPVKTAQRAAYLAQAQATAPLFRAHGALSVVECWGEDVPPGKLTSFPLAVQCAPDETVVFAWITWPDRATRDKGMAAAMADPRMVMDPAIFDGKRLIFGGFEVILDA